MIERGLPVDRLPWVLRRASELQSPREVESRLVMGFAHDLAMRPPQHCFPCGHGSFDATRANPLVIILTLPRFSDLDLLSFTAGASGRALASG